MEPIFMGLNDTREINLNGVSTLSSDARLMVEKMVTNSKMKTLFDYRKSYDCRCWKKIFRLRI
jgi:hypothetical protein